jgi:hypothetical protein
LGPKLKGRERFSTKKGMQVVKQILIEDCPPSLLDEEFSDRARKFTPKVKLPAGLVITRFQPLIDASRKRMEDFYGQYDRELAEGGPIVVADFGKDNNEPHV